MDDSMMTQSVAAGSGESPNCTDDEEIMQLVLNYKFAGVADSFMWEGADEEERRAMVNAILERMERTKKALLQWQDKLPTKDEESRKAKESAMQQEQVRLKDKLDILDLDQEYSNRTTADPNSMTIQDDHVDGGKSVLAKKMADEDARSFAHYRSSWESNSCKDCDHFERKTVLSSMQFTPYTPGTSPYNVAETLQIFSMELKLTDDNAAGFEFPLSLYGVVAVRDTLDSRQNILFSCGRTRAQELTQDDPFLHLTGPSRAILSLEKVDFEIDLKVKGAAPSEDKLLIASFLAYYQCISTLCFDNLFCTLEVCLQTVQRAVQATIIGVQMVDKHKLSPLTFRYGGQVACIPLPGNQKIVLTESRDREMLQGHSGYLHLSRQVVCVEQGGGLDVVIQGYKKSGVVAAEGRVHFITQNCQMSQQQCIVGPLQVTVTVAWSAVPTDMDDDDF